MKRTYIYKLVDPITKEPKYVGRSVNPTARSYAHTRLSTSSKYLVAWIRGWWRRGYHPDMVILEQCDESRADELELFWIQEFKRQGHDLLNRKGICVKWPEPA